MLALVVCARLQPRLPHPHQQTIKPAPPLTPPLPRAVVVPTSIFMTNKRGFPTLSRRHQDFLADCFTRNVQVRLIHLHPL